MSAEHGVPLLPGLEEESHSPSLPVSPWMLTELGAVGAGGEAARALQFIPHEHRDEIHSFFLHFYAPDHAAILSALERRAEEVIRAGCNLPVGGISLVGHARCTVRGFALGNDLAVFYVLALRLKRPEWARYLECTSLAADYLLRSGWNPFAGEGRR